MIGKNQTNFDMRRLEQFKGDPETHGFSHGEALTWSALIIQQVHSTDPCFLIPRWRIYTTVRKFDGNTVSTQISFHNIARWTILREAAILQQDRPGTQTHNGFHVMADVHHGAACLSHAVHLSQTFFLKFMIANR